MENRFLLTGLINGIRDYLWFENEDELLEFIDSNGVSEYDAIEIINARDIILDE